MATREEERRARAGALIGENKLDALLVTNLVNVRYLTGFTGSNGQLLVLRDGSARLMTDPRYDVQARRQATCKVDIVKGPMFKSAAKAIGKTKVRRTGFEAGSMAWATWKAIEEAVPSKARLLAADGLVESLRDVKDAWELELIRTSCATNSRALESALAAFREGMTEAELAAEIDYRSRREGATGPSFDTILASGKQSALPHAHPPPEPIRAGILLIDLGAFSNSYTTDIPL